jgi:hypothetical protein
MTIWPKWSCRSDIWNLLQKTPYKPVLTSLEFFFKRSQLSFLFKKLRWNGLWISNFENNYQNYQNACDSYLNFKHVLISNFLEKASKFSFKKIIEVILCNSHMAHDKWTSWITNFENNYQNYQNVHGRYLISWWCDNVILYSLLSLMACYTIHTNVFLFNYLGIEVYNHYLYDVSYRAYVFPLETLIIM